MKEQLISFETAKLAKEKGFDLPTINCYNVDNRLLEFIPVIKGGIKDAVLHGGDILFDDWNNNGKESKSAPTQSLLQKWLREKHDIHIMICPKQLPDNSIVYYIYKNKTKRNFNGLFDTYEEALETALQEELKLI
jgi:hypothetical protein